MHKCCLTRVAVVVIGIFIIYISISIIDNVIIIGGSTVITAKVQDYDSLSKLRLSFLEGVWILLAGTVIMIDKY